MQSSRSKNVTYQFPARNWAISASVSHLIRVLFKNTRDQHTMLFSVGDEPADVTSHRAWKIMESVSSLPRLLEGLPSRESSHKRVEMRREGTEVRSIRDQTENLPIPAISLKITRFAPLSSVYLNISYVRLYGTSSTTANFFHTLQDCTEKLQSP